MKICSAAATAAKLLVSISVQPHRRQPTRLLHPWDSPGKNTGVGCHFLFQYMKVKSESEVTQSCPTLSDPMDCGPPGSSIHGIFQARVLEWGAILVTANFECQRRGKVLIEQINVTETLSFWVPITSPYSQLCEWASKCLEDTWKITLLLSVLIRPLCEPV